MARRTPRRESAPQAFAKCPACAEEILPTETTCPFCDERLTGPSSPAGPPRTPSRTPSRSGPSGRSGTGTRSRRARHPVRRSSSSAGPVIALIVIAAIVGAIWLAGAVSGNRIEVLVVHTAGRTAQVLVDGSPVTLSPKGQGMGALTVSTGSHRLTVKEDGEVILDENFNANQPRTTVAYCSQGEWLAEERIVYEVETTVSRFGPASFGPLANTSSIHLDGTRISIELLTDRELDEFERLVGYAQSVYSRPTVRDYLSSKFFGPHQQVPDEIDSLPGELQGSQRTFTRTALTIVPADGVEFLRMIIERSQGGNDEGDEDGDDDW